MAAFRSATHFMASTGVKIASGLAVIKFISFELGPEGFGLLSQLMTAIAITAMLAGGGITNGTIKVLSNSPYNTEEGKKWLSAAFTLTTLVSITIALPLIILAKPLSGALLKKESLYLFFCLAATQTIIAYGNLIQAEASSRTDSAFYAKINVLGTILGTIIIAILIRAFGFEGAALGLILMPALPGVIALFHAFNKQKDLLGSLRWRFDLSRIKHLMSFSTVTLIGAISLPASQIITREIFGERHGWSDVGIWQGAVKISDVYMQFIGVMLINHAMPRFAAAVDTRQALIELRKTLTLLLTIIIIGLATLYTLRTWVIQFIFSDEFLEISNLLPAQFAGDILRTVSASISFFFMARGHIIVPIVYEIGQGFIFIISFLALQESTGNYAPVYAHLASCSSLAIMMIFSLSIFFKKTDQ